MALHHSRESKPKRLRNEAKYVHNGGHFDAMKISRHLIVDGESINAVFLSNFSFFRSFSKEHCLDDSSKLGHFPVLVDYTRQEQLIFVDYVR